jgi:hypothetical protein
MKHAAKRPDRTNIRSRSIWTCSVALRDAVAGRRVRTSQGIKACRIFAGDPPCPIHPTMVPCGSPWAVSARPCLRRTTDRAALRGLDTFSPEFRRTALCGRARLWRYNSVAIQFASRFGPVTSFWPHVRHASVRMAPGRHGEVERFRFLGSRC